ncbi:MAG: phosphate ABC transporter permease PstA [Bacillales bacterium]|nr:phosphate ABC transporter permease PstA [Bacillales bacterium]
MRKTKDLLSNIFTYLFSSFGIIILFSILIFIFRNGLSSLSWKLITSDYYETTYTLKTAGKEEGTFTCPTLTADEYFSYRYGVVLKDSTNLVGEEVVEITYIAEDSPFLSLINTSSEEIVSLECGFNISKIVMSNDIGDYIYALGRGGASNMASTMDTSNIITDMVASEGGGGIRGSLISTLYLILLTLIISLPIGVLAAIYLNEYAPKKRFIEIIRGMIDMVAGIPSIIFGLVGAIIFIPFCNNTIGSSGGSIASGALTMSLILLPTIIKTTEEALKVIPKGYRDASLALGASKTQTINKVILPNAIPGILTAVLLSIGRIIGESAALIYAVGVAIKDTIKINEKSTTLAVHIWSLMSGENPNIATSCAISIIILLVVFTLNVIVKLISKKLNKMEVK